MFRILRRLTIYLQISHFQKKELLIRDNMKRIQDLILDYPVSARLYSDSETKLIGNLFKMNTEVTNQLTKVMHRKEQLYKRLL